ncbi:Ulp1 protease [Reticulomyxa filosa]|uniref:Ulp1 protease n=1 Tax=Reticulomyxa filosa TaxID=46433 RepID=X6NHN4_RETFI|nr:Ulp1 protease [Reticulomyxa filosa]|eukprot:ETO25259.1 Ulp1 protease [Reticulomyxa filosa]
MSHKLDPNYEKRKKYFQQFSKNKYINIVGLWLFKKKKTLSVKPMNRMIGYLEEINLNKKVELGKKGTNLNTSLTISTDKLIKQTDKLLDCRAKEQEKNQTDKQKQIRDAKMKPLTEEQKKLVQRTFDKANKDISVLIASNEELGQVYGKDIIRLQPRIWLNDEIINYYAAMLGKRNRTRFENKQCECSVVLMNSFFYTKLAGSGYKFSNVSRWTKPAQLQKRCFSKKVNTIFDLHKVIIPINMSNTHWVCACINIAEKRFEFYDSMGSDGKQFYEIFKRYVEDEIKDKKLEIKYNWNHYHLKGIPRQNNAYDCGVFTCKFMDWLCDNLTPDFSQTDMCDFRLKMAHEIITNELLLQIFIKKKHERNMKKFLLVELKEKMMKKSDEKGMLGYSLVKWLFRLTLLSIEVNVKVYK